MSDSNETNEMKKIDCDTTGDLLPLYVDEVLSPSSVALVEAHLAECESCTEKLNTLQSETKVKDYENVKPMKKFKKQFRRNRIITGVTLGTVAVVLLGLFLWFFEYTYSYDELKDDIEIVSTTDGHVYVIYTGDKLLFTNYTIKMSGVKDGKALYTMSIYENFNLRDWWDYQTSLFQKTDRESGKPFLLCSVCPNDDDGMWCHDCMNEERYVSNLTIKNGVEYFRPHNFNRPNEESPFEWTMEDWYDNYGMTGDAYENMKMEIFRVEYRRFNSLYYKTNLDSSTSIWIREDIPYASTDK